MAFLFFQSRFLRSARWARQALSIGADCQSCSVIKLTSLYVLPARTLRSPSSTRLYVSEGIAMSIDARAGSVG